MARRSDADPAQFSLFAEEAGTPMHPPESELLTPQAARLELNDQIYTRYMYTSLKELGLISRNVSLLTNPKVQQRELNKRGEEAGKQYLEDVTVKTAERLAIAQKSYAEALGYTASGQEILAKEGELRRAWNQFRANYGGPKRKKARDFRIKQLAKKAEEHGYELSEVE